MKVKLIALRQDGELRVPIAAARRISGELSFAHEPMPGEDRSIPVLRVLGNDLALYDPRLTRICAGTIKFMGLERVGRAWYAQEWTCEVDY